MRKVFSRIILFIILLSTACGRPDGIDSHVKLSAGEMTISLDGAGRITELFIGKDRENLLHPDSMTYLIRLHVDRRELLPEKMEYDPEKKVLYFTFPGGYETRLIAKTKTNYLVFRVDSISPVAKPGILIWGPVYTRINETIGETVGVVRNQEHAVGLQSLNPKTLGGYPWRENDVMPEMDYFDQEDYSDLRSGGIGHTLYRIEAARPVPGGSALQAYCRNRKKARNIKNLGYINYTVRPYDDGGIKGSAIALFGCMTSQVLDIIEKIELGEGLPHPKIDGQWSKTAPGASAAYMIMDFSEADIEKALDYTSQAGLRYLYHSGPFERWGHFKLKAQAFPEGRKSMKRCVEKAKERGILLGVHTLSNFITTNDAYVTPVPDQRLAVVGTSTLSKGIARNAKKIIIEDPSFFNQYKNNHLKAARIGDEIIRYGAVTETMPWTLNECQRGAFGTKASSHLAGDSVHKLADHAYKVLLSNPELSLEIAENIATLFNETGLRQISFDGLEGNRSTGMGNYGEILFTTHWYESLNDDIRSHYIADASRSSHYFWHIFTRMNWGEPWYAGFRESQTEYRLKNQQYFDRNYIPNMLGWFLMKPQTSIEDIEWLMARSAAFDAGFAFVTSYDALERNGKTDATLEAINLWEATRMKGLFTDEQKQLMKDVGNEFTLEQKDDSTLSLTRIYPYRAEHKNTLRQPGEPLSSRLEINNPSAEQPMNFIITADQCVVINPWLEINGSRKTTIPVKLNDGEHLKFDGRTATVYSPEWRSLKSIALNGDQLAIAPGQHRLETGCQFTGIEGKMKVEIRLAGKKHDILIK